MRRSLSYAFAFVAAAGACQSDDSVTGSANPDILSKGLGDEDCYSAFDGTDLGLQLRRLGVNEVWVGGLATDYCVKNTVLDGLKEGFAVRALEDAMRPVELKPGDGERALEEMRTAGAEIVSSVERAVGQ
jgi:nicotinamidase/pyrazinamidase